MKRRLGLFDKAALLVTMFVLAGASAAGVLAYFSSGGSGTGSATVGTVLPVTVTPGIPSSVLYPGGAADVAFTVANSNGGPVYVPSLQLDTTQGTNGLSVDAGHAGCGVSAVHFTPASTGWMVPVNASSFVIDLPAAMSMDPSAASACQDARFTVYLKVGP